MKRIQYWRGDQYIGTDFDITEDRNPYDLCPFCHRKAKTVYSWYNEDWGSELPQGCFQCVDAYVAGDKGYHYELDPDYYQEFDVNDYLIDMAYEDRQDREIMAALRGADK